MVVLRDYTKLFTENKGYIASGIILMIEVFLLRYTIVKEGYGVRFRQVENEDEAET